MRNIVGGAAVAIVIAFAMIVPSIRGVATWKYILGAIGFALFVFAGRNSRSK